MRAEEFCDKAVSKVRWVTPEEREEIWKELAGHMADHAGALEETGTAAEEAEALAVEAMGDPEEIGRALARAYPWRWWWLSRMALLACILVCGGMLIGLLYEPPALLDDLACRFFPTWRGSDLGRIGGFDAVEELDLRERVASHVVYVYGAGLSEVTEEGALASVTLCVYSTDPLAGSAKIPYGSIYWETDTEDGEYAPMEQERYYILRNIPARRDGTVTVVYDSAGGTARIDVPLPWEDVT